VLDLRPDAAELPRVRRADTADLAAVLAVGREAWRATFAPLVGTAYTEAGLRRAWAPEVIAAEIAAGWVLVAGDATDTVGMASARPDGLHTFLNRLYVRPSRQRRGVGHVLLNTVMRSAIGPVTLTVLSTNDAARAFYRGHGFQDDGRQPDPDGGPDHVRMTHPESDTERSVPTNSQDILRGIKWAP
jgi:ribosomal protein S18 acetylase RimI-like enzyme